MTVIAGYQQLELNETKHILTVKGAPEVLRGMVGSIMLWIQWRNKKKSPGNFLFSKGAIFVFVRKFLKLKRFSIFFAREKYPDSLLYEHDIIITNFTFAEVVWYRYILILTFFWQHYSIYSIKNSHRTTTPFISILPWLDHEF